MMFTLMFGPHATWNTCFASPSVPRYKKADFQNTRPTAGRSRVYRCIYIYIHTHSRQYIGILKVVRGALGRCLPQNLPQPTIIGMCEFSEP